MIRLLSSCSLRSALPVRVSTRTVFYHGSEWKPTLDMGPVSQNVQMFKENVSNRALGDIDVDAVLQEHERYLGLQKELEVIGISSEDLHKRIRMANNDDVKRRQLGEEGRKLKSRIRDLKNEISNSYTKHISSAVSLPNLTSPHTPVGGYDMAKEICTFGQKPEFQFEHRNYKTLGTKHRMLDVSSGLMATSPSTIYLRGPGALLENALVSYVFQLVAAKSGFEPVIPPDIVRETVLKACGFVARSQQEQVFRLGEHDAGLVLSGTGELQLAAMCASSARPRRACPQKYVASSHCFRREAGDTTGLFRLHQFTKVEMFGVTNNTVEASDDLLMEFAAIQQEILESLGLHGRLLEMPTAELGNPAYRKLDMEVWMPGYNDYKEVCSASNCTDYQARRLQIYFGPFFTPRLSRSNREFCHTVNATAIAVPRVIIALLETHQQADGSVLVPACLRPYLGNRDVLVPPPWPKLDFHGKQVVQEMH